MSDETIADEFVVEFGSHVRFHPNTRYLEGTSPRDIDAFYHGMKKKTAKMIVQQHYPEWTGPIDLTKVTFYCSSHRIERDAEGVETKTWIEPCVTIPYPYDRSDQAGWKVLHSTPVVPVVKTESVTGSLPSIFRGSCGVEVALDRIGQGYPWTICVENRGGMRNPEDRLYGYNNGRLAIVKAALDHFGEENFREVCQRIWWGPFLERLVQEKPSKAGRAECRKYCPMGGLTTVTVNGDTPAKANFSSDYGPYRITGSGLHEFYFWSLEDIMRLLF